MFFYYNESPLRKGVAVVSPHLDLDAVGELAKERSNLIYFEADLTCD